jgi:glutamate-1-semialdehyde 2,1-aminomutase
MRASPASSQACASLCTQHGALLIVDEVMTGFRVGLGGAQSVYGVTPGTRHHLGQGHRRRHAAGRPLAASARSWSSWHPLGPVYQAGTLSGNPVATACGLATLREIRKPGFYEALTREDAEV